KVEQFLLNLADGVGSISGGMLLELQEKCNGDIDFVATWADVKIFHPIANQANITEEFGFDPKDEIALYSGAIGQKQGLEAILHAADYFKLRKEVKFVICGSGPYKSTLESLAKSMELNNVYFLPL